VFIGAATVSNGGSGQQGWRRRERGWREEKGCVACRRAGPSQGHRATPGMTHADHGARAGGHAHVRCRGVGAGGRRSHNVRGLLHGQAMRKIWQRRTAGAPFASPPASRRAGRGSRRKRRSSSNSSMSRRRIRRGRRTGRRTPGWCRLPCRHRRAIRRAHQRRVRHREWQAQLCTPAPPTAQASIFAA